MTDRAFLQWLHERLIYVYGESPQTGFCLRLRRIVEMCVHEDYDPDTSKVE